MTLLGVQEFAPDQISIVDGLELEHVHLGHANELHEMFQNDADRIRVGEWIALAKDCTPRMAMSFCATAELHRDTERGVHYWITENGVKSGYVGFLRERGAPDTWEGRYWLLSTALGRGLAAQAVGVGTEFTFDELLAREVWFRVHRKNTQSEQLVRRLNATGGNPIEGDETFNAWSLYDE